ncbi:MAG: S8 family serine peptidase [Promethearchaeota archaeon]
MTKNKKLYKYLLLVIVLGTLFTMTPINFVAAEADFELYDTGRTPLGHTPTYPLQYQWQTVEHLSGNTYRFKIKFTSSTYWSQANLVIDGVEHQVTKYSTYGDYFFDYSCYCYHRREYYQYSYVDLALNEFGYYEYYYNSWMLPDCTTDKLWAIYFSPFISDTGRTPLGHTPTYPLQYQWQTVEHLSGNTYRFKIKFTSSTYWSQANLVIDGVEHQVTKYSTYGDYFFDYSCYCYHRREYYQYSYVDLALDESGYYEYYYNSYMLPDCTTDKLWAIYFGPSTLDGSINRFFLDPGPKPSKLGFQIESTYDFGPQTPFITYQLINGLGLYDDVSIVLYVDDQLIDSRFVSLASMGDSIEVQVDSNLLKQIGTHRIEIQVSDYYYMNENWELGYLKVGYIGFTQHNDILDWGIDLVNAEVVWGGFDGATNVVTNIYGQGIKVLVIDVGIDYNHFDLNDNYYGGYDWQGGDNNPMDTNGHGTHCSGIIAAEDNDAGVIGIAPFAKIYMARVGVGPGIDSEYVKNAIYWGINNHVDIISMSLSTYNILSQACQDAYNEGIVLVAASGNNNGAISYPAKYDSVIAVGAINSGLTRASFSNYGSELDLVAPGVDIYSTVLNSNFDYMSGTSMACPMVAGVCALILCTNPFMQPREVRWCLYNSTTDLGSSGWDQYYGWGLVNAEAAVNYALTHFPL